MNVNISRHENELAVSLDYSQERITNIKSTLTVRRILCMKQW